MEEELLQLQGTVEGIIRDGEEDGFYVFEVSGGGELYTVCGEVGTVHVGETVVCTGTFVNHPSYGRQFRAQTCQADIPRDIEAIYAYLCSGALPYIRLATAKKIVEKFGTESLAVIANAPLRLAEIRGLNEEKARRISEEYHRMFGVREVIAYFAKFDIAANRAVELYKSYGSKAAEAVEKNPYLLCGEPLQLTFSHADKIAAQLQFAADSSLRLGAALGYVLRHNANNGHTCLPRHQLVQTTAAFLSVGEQALEEELDARLEAGDLQHRTFDEIVYIFLPDLLDAEEEIAFRLAELAARPQRQVKALERNLELLQLTRGVAYAPMQKQAIITALRSNCFVLTGGPGTGKTTTINAILALLENDAERVALCAPTGRAAKRLSELTDHKASTIHRLLEVDYSGGVVSFIHNAQNLLKYDVIILDEMSMVDAKLFQSLLAAMRPSCRIVMVGDTDQLPSVGPGNVLGEIIASEVVPTVRLSEIFRQAAESLIVENAHNIVENKPLKKGGKESDFFFLQAAGLQCQQLICDLAAVRLPRSYGFDPIRDIQVLCPTKIGLTGATALNTELQQLLNPPAYGKAEIKTPGKVFRTGDKVMQVKNNYDIVWQRDGGEQGVGAYNGDIGIITAVNPHDRSLVVQMDDRRLVYSSDHFSELEIAYAVTIHKSQGSEFPAVIIPVDSVPQKLCYRNLIYTGITRARQLCVVAGQGGTMRAMVENTRQKRRYSCLAQLLREKNSTRAEEER